jgi:undecaprenyl diphosphate synthase
MDGNGRWAKAKGMPRVFGHHNGVKTVKVITEAAAELGIKYLTLYAFSKENWNRPKLEVDALMSLLVETVKKEIKTLNDNNVRLLAIGDLSKLPKKTAEALKWAIDETSKNNRMSLVLALNYSARWELTEAAIRIGEKVHSGVISPNEINDKLLESFLATAGIPDPELLIRTSGEFRISNFLLWQIAYAELYFTNTLWPDFSKEHLYEAIIDFQKRERRFGKISEQISS